VRFALPGLLILASLPLWFGGQSRNPPGFAADEASIALNALTIARYGTDEDGNRYPLYFRAFGDYKNPPYIYLLAGVFKVVEPSPLAARRLSAVFGWLAAAALGSLAWRMTRLAGVAAAAFTLAILTPALFEMSRLAFEVALFPLVVALFLLAAWEAFHAPRWSLLLTAALAVTLALVTYAYTAGRLLGPLFALLLLLLAKRRRDVVVVWILFALLAVVPSLIYHLRNDRALTRRPGDVQVQGLREVAENVQTAIWPWSLALEGDPNPRHHVQGAGGSILLAALLLAPLGLALGWQDRWSLFLLLAGIASLLPAVLSSEVRHSLRAAAYPVFLVAMAIPAFASIRFRRLVAALGILAAAQAAWFYIAFHRRGGERKLEFDAGVPQVVVAALAQPSRPIYVRPSFEYVHTLWYAMAAGADRGELVRLPQGVDPPPNAVAVSSWRPAPSSRIAAAQAGRPPSPFLPPVLAPDCTILAEWGRFAAYRCP